MTDQRKKGGGGVQDFILIYVLSAVFCLLSSAQADDIAVQKAEARFYGDSYQLSVDFEIHFNAVVEQALTRGVPLYFITHQGREGYQSAGQAGQRRRDLPLQFDQGQAQS